MNKKSLFYALAFVLCLALPACSKFSHKGRDRGGDDGGEYKPPKKFSSPEVSLKNCDEHKPKRPSFSPMTDLIFSGSGKNPTRKLANCIEKSMDLYLKPICDEENRLKKELKKYQNDEELVAEIEEDMEELERLKYDYAEDFYDFAELPGEIYEDIDDECSTETDDHAF